MEKGEKKKKKKKYASSSHVHDTTIAAETEGWRRWEV
jgi:hypothetical protein